MNIITPTDPSKEHSLSIIMPAIRPERWERVYDSIGEAYAGDFELIICSPFPLPEKLQYLKNVKYVKDFGNPVRASNIAGMLCENELVTWTADDAVYLPDSLNKMVYDWHWMEGGGNEKVIVGKYYEGQDGSDKPLQNDTYFKINGGDSTRCLTIPDDYWLFNIALMTTSFFDRIGHWDNRFEGTFCAHTDMAVRAQRNGAKVKMCNVPILDCGHMPGTSGDHAPIHYAQLSHDEPLFRYLYGGGTIKIGDIPRPRVTNHWKDVPRVWERRFV
jgi:hypothetical protein